MYLQVPKMQIVCFIMSLFFAPLALASGGESAEAKPADAHATPPKKKSNEESYAAVLGKVQALEAKVRSGEAEIQKLVLAKAAASSTQQVNEIIKNMLSLHHELKANIQDYERQRSLLKYRYPEKSLADGREYERMELKSLEEMEGAASLSASIRHTMQKVRIQFPDQEAKDEASRNSKDASNRSPASERPVLFEPVILKK